MPMREQPHQDDPDATITALRMVRLRLATPDGEASSFEFSGQSADDLLAALTNLAVAGFRRCAELEGCVTVDAIRDWGTARVDELIEDVTLQAVSDQDSGQ